MHSPLETIDEVEHEEWETSSDPEVIKTARTSAKRRHTIEVNQLIADINASNDADSIKLQRKMVVRDYNDLERKHNRYLQVTGRNADANEIKWLADVTKQLSDALVLADGYLSSVEMDIRSQRTVGSRSSSASQALARLQEAERLEQESELKLAQAKIASAKEHEEELLL